MSKFKIFAVIGLAAVFLIAGCKKEDVTVEPGARKKREISEESQASQELEMDLSNIEL